MTAEAHPVVVPAVMVVGFSTTGSWISRVIRWLTGSTVSHAYMRFHVADQDVVLHADYRGIAVMSLKRFAGSCTVVAEYAVDLPWQALIPEIVADLGADYDFGGLVGQGWVLVGSALGAAWENPWQDEEQWYCSEFVAHLLELVGEPLPVKASAISPAVLMALLGKSGRATLVGATVVP